MLVIKDIYIRNCGSSCTCDYLEIQNGSSSDGISGRRRCRYEDRGIVYHSVKDVLRVTFVSDSGKYRRYRGFKATYIKVKYNATNTGKLFVPSSTLSNIFRSLVKPYLSYGIAVWGQAAPTNLEKILILQKRALRLIHFKPFRFPAVPLLKLSNALPLNFRYFKTICLIMHDILKNVSPPNVSNSFTYSSKVHHHNTRFSAAGTFYIKHSRTGHKKSYFSRIGAKI